MCLAKPAGKMRLSCQQVIACYIPLENWCPSCHRINPLLTSLVQSRWLDIGLILLLTQLWMETHLNTKKEGQYPELWFDLALGQSPIFTFIANNNTINFYYGGSAMWGFSATTSTVCSHCHPGWELNLTKIHISELKTCDPQGAEEFIITSQVKEAAVINPISRLFMWP